METQQPALPSEPIIPPATHKPEVKNSLVLIMSVLLIIAVAIAGLFYFQIQKLSKELSQLQVQVQPTPTPTASQAPNSDLANWKTYNDPKGKYSFKYPARWEINQLPTGNNGILISDQQGPNEDQISLEISSIKLSDVAFPGCKQIQQALLDNVTASRCELAQEIATERGIVYNPPIISKTIYIEALHNGLYYIISLTFDQTSDKFKIFDQILSTFHFLK